MSVRKERTLLFEGYAKLPGNIAPEAGSDLLILELEVDPSSDIIINTYCSQIPPLGAKLISNVLIGYDLKQTLSSAHDQIQECFFGPAQRAVISALEKAYEGYLRYKKPMSEEQKSDKSS